MKLLGFALASLFFLLTGCGQTGPLQLPEYHTDIQNKQESVASKPAKPQNKQAEQQEESPSSE